MPVLHAEVFYIQIHAALSSNPLSQKISLFLYYKELFFMEYYEKTQQETKFIFRSFVSL